MRRNAQCGFTLIELLVVIGILGVLASLGLQSFSVYRANAAFATTQRTVSDARTDAEGSLANPDILVASVASTTQKEPGPLADAAARAFLPATTVPRNIALTVSFDSGCLEAGCQSAQIQARHLYGRRYTQWTRFGDGVWTVIELPGDGW